jgi:hypothetical protein
VRLYGREPGGRRVAIRGPGRAPEGSGRSGQRTQFEKDTRDRRTPASLHCPGLPEARAWPVTRTRPSEAARRRVAELVAREKTTGLSAAESSELDHYVQLGHLLRLPKARARRHLAP